MKLYVNLIPAIAYALATMFSNMAGLTGEVEKTAKKQQVVSLPVTHHEFNSLNNCVLVAKNGQLILSNGNENANLVWKIPYTPDTKQLNQLLVRVLLLPLE
ncbi:MAG: hypothetical protein NTZ69_14690 [Bacteroidia bacterium]|nr:hypothetical protein [Bacteroidia bacterium]